MRKNKQKTRKEKLSTLIDAVRERYSDEEILKVFISRLDWRETNAFSDAILNEKELSNSVTESLRNKDMRDGFLVLKVENFDKRERLHEFIFSEIYPYRNDQVTELFYS
jgi:hypothetical protein